ncbi:MAG TPA: hypothetical protein VMT21_00995 [Gemmatimonadales bacterium]|nr:hypothetical protein [Gemmatimonadales bacterium]
MTRTRTSLLIAAALLAARPAAAQESVFGVRGLGFLAQPISAHSAAMGGGESMFDGNSAVSPASLAAWQKLAGWAVGAQSNRSFNPGSGAVSLNSMRFPTFGFATPVGYRLVVGVTVSEYLNRNWEVQRADTVWPRGLAVPVADHSRSVGGVSDVRFAAAYRVSSRIAVGIGLHTLSGSAQTAVERDFPTDSTYHTFAQVTETDYRGFGVSLGLLASPTKRLVVGASARFNGRLSATNPGGNASVRLPSELAGGLYVVPWDGITVATTIIHDSWSVAAPDLVAAGQLPSRDVWSVGVGAEIALLRMFGEVVPLRAGYRWRQLPFPVDTALFVSERAASGGITFSLAGGRANLDLAVQGGSRTAGTLKESFTTILVGLSIFP